MLIVDIVPVFVMLKVIRAQQAAPKQIKTSKKYKSIRRRVGAHEPRSSLYRETVLLRSLIVLQLMNKT